MGSNTHLYTLRLGIAFLEQAKADMEASKILYDKDFYSHALFFLQQSAEKSYKALRLVFQGFLEEVKVRLQKLIDILPDVKNYIEKFIENINNNVLSGKDLDNFLKNTVRHNPAGIIVCDYMSIMRILRSFLDSLLQIIQDLGINVSNNIVTGLRRYKERVIEKEDQVLNMLEGNKRKSYRAIAAYINQNINPPSDKAIYINDPIVVLLNSLRSHGSPQAKMLYSKSYDIALFIRKLYATLHTLFSLNLILSNQYNILRYPGSNTNNVAPHKYFNADCILIKSYKDFYDAISISIERIEALYKIINELIKIDISDIEKMIMDRLQGKYILDNPELKGIIDTLLKIIVGVK
ncbi:HEPN domain-containing protein [Saccharolobus caldissimus]|uniref:HEPN domain-containing protein n=1 Tax=Saccharolobus caldissimus TaxID=1702097 RepID=A0AAQ4CRR0_9CREN|nr:HEPN domain-containing protein [Saccharolobus caldissimus]BDB98491.1 hypothetical protein SACC_15080 [Saccharolobus caldissimus]